MFTSNLSVNEFVLSKQSKLTPLGQVMGNSAYCLNRSVFDNRVDTGEIKALSRPLREVYLKAFCGLQQEARRLQAHIVIGVRLEETRKYRHLWTPKNVIEVKAIGTAVAWEAGEAPENASLSGLSGQELYTLRCAGYHSVGLVLGYSVYYQLSQAGRLFSTIPKDTSLLDYGRINPNMERTDYTKAVSKARELADKRMRSEAEHLQAEGIVGVSLKHQVSLQESGLLIEFLALGTAITSSELMGSKVDYSISLSS